MKTNMTESELRDFNPEWPKTTDELVALIKKLVEQKHDYGTCVYAMSIAAVSAFHYVARELGCHRISSLLRRLGHHQANSGMEGPFILLKGQDMLYPQYDLPRKLCAAMDEWREWAKKEAQKKLDSGTQAHPDVIAHWKKLAL